MTAPDPYLLAAALAYAEGRREQKCPACGREEAGGSHCSGCCRPMWPDAWTNDTAASRAGRTAAAARRAALRATRSARADEGPNEGHNATPARSAPYGPRRPSRNARRPPLRVVSAAPATT